MIHTAYSAASCQSGIRFTTRHEEKNPKRKMCTNVSFDPKYEHCVIAGARRSPAVQLFDARTGRLYVSSDAQARSKADILSPTENMLWQILSRGMLSFKWHTLLATPSSLVMMLHE